MTTTISVQDVLSAGYVFFPYHLNGEYCKGGYQKVVRGPGGEKLYYINLYLWKFPADEHRAEHNSWACGVRLYRSRQVSFDLDLLPEENTTIEDIEAFYSDAYVSMRCCPVLNQ